MLTTILKNIHLALLAACLAVFSRWLWNTARQRCSGLCSPPGPPGVPLLGNVFDIPAVDSHIKYFELAKKYGPLFSFTLLNRSFVVISSTTLASELLDKRGTIYSDRPPFPMSDAAGYDWNLTFMRHNESWRVRRRLVHQKFNVNATVKLRGLLRRSTLELAKNLIRSPENFRKHLRRLSASYIMESVYGIQIAEENDPYVEIAHTAMAKLGEVVVPGSNPVDVLPFLLWFPAWVPVLGHWTKWAQSLRKYPRNMVETPYARTKDDIARVARPCMAIDGLEIMQDDPVITEQIVKDACAVSYLAGADTTVSVLLSFVMAMVLYPEYQLKAQEEVDRVLGERLPDFGDEASLPYIEAIIRETYRVYPVAPFAAPHATKEDDVYQGVLIRKGTTVIPNVWAMMRDEDVYQDPHKFNPNRWIKHGAIDPHAPDPRTSGIFGFGRRVCPGRHLGDASVFISIATLLKCFTFRKHVENGLDVPPSGEIHTGIVSCPAPFKCAISPRSGSLQALLDAALEAAED
ncbi:putative CyP450 monooxygenase [Auricularia subglabra TFB-10046 SS5]|nr:putative CyP450 monooxygenase [Auricularia subglabra TFB-10046 SS5]